MAPKKLKKRKRSREGDKEEAPPYRFTPDEIVELIVLNLKTNKNDDTTTYQIKIKALAAMSRASRQLHRIVHPMLWKDVRLDTHSSSSIKLFLQSILVNPQHAELVKDITITALYRKASRTEGLPLQCKQPYIDLCHKAVNPTKHSPEFKKRLNRTIEAQQWCAGYERLQLLVGEETCFFAAELILVFLCCTKIERIVFVPDSPGYVERAVSNHVHGGLLQSFISQRVALQSFDDRNDNTSFSAVRDIDISAYSSLSELALIKSVQCCHMEAGFRFGSTFRTKGRCTNVRKLTLINRSNHPTDELYLPKKLNDFPALVELVIHDYTAASLNADTQMSDFGQRLRESGQQLTRLTLHGWNTAGDRYTGLLIGSLRELHNLTQLCLPQTSVLNRGYHVPHQLVAGSTTIVPAGEMIRILPASLARLHLYACNRDSTHPAEFLLSQYLYLVTAKAEYPAMKEIVWNASGHWTREALEPFKAIGWMVETVNAFEAPGIFSNPNYACTTIVLRRGGTEPFEDTRCCKMACGDIEEV